jgi:prepilin peptidase CpaA
MHSIAWWPTLFVMSLAAGIDLRTRRIPNWLVVPFLLAGLAISFFAPPPGTGPWNGLAGMAVAAAIMTPLYLLGAMGMGDVKLCAALGAWVGPHQSLFALAFMGLAGGLLALIWAICGGFVSSLCSGAGDLIGGFARHGLRRHETLVLSNPQARSIPYAPAIAVGAILSFFVSQ